MALSDICNFNSYMKSNNMSPDALHSDMMDQCCNLDNNLQLAMPPFSNVRLNNQIILKAYQFHHEKEKFPSKILYLFLF